MKRIEPRELVRTVSSKYAIFQGGDEIGREVVTRSDYNDNSVQYQSEVALKYTAYFTGFLRLYSQPASILDEKRLIQSHSFSKVFFS